MKDTIKKIFSCSGLKKKLSRRKNNRRSKQSKQDKQDNKPNPRWIQQLFGRKSKKKIPAKSLPTDCLLEIFKYFQNDLRTLYSCLLVNRHWCISTVRLIWKHPFLNKSFPKVIDVYLSCLTPQGKNNLIKNGVDLSNCMKPATFYYANFLRQLNMENFYTAVNVWTKENNIVEKRSTDLVCRALCRLFMSNCENIQRLCLNWNFIGRWKSYPIFPYHKNASRFLNELSELSINHVNTRDIFFDISKHSQNLVKLELLDRCFDNLPEHRHKSIHTLIKNQKNLQYFKLFAYGNCPVIPMKALNFQSNSLIHFELIYAKFNSDNSLNAFMPLSNCHNLETLIIEHCYFEDQVLLQPLITSNFPHLRKIRFKNLQIDAAEIFIGLIKNNSSSLRELHYSDDFSRRFMYSFLEAIVTYSTTSLISLTIPFRNCQTPHLITLLSFSNQLQSLKLIGPYGQERAFVEFLPELAKLLPNSLQNLSLDLNWVIINTLHQFFSNLKSPIKTLYITGWSRRILDKHIIIINEYLRKNGNNNSGSGSGLNLYQFLKDIT